MSGHQLVAHAVHAENRLLLSALDRNEAHLRPRHGFADRFGIIAVVLLITPERSDKLGHHDPRLMAEGLQLARHLMRPRTRFHANPTTRQLGEHIEELVAGKGLAKNRLAVRVDAMHTEDVRGQIDTDGGHFTHGCLLK